MRFSQTHEWVFDNQGIATIGITAYAQKELGEIVYVELPVVGSKVKAGQEAAVLESTKAAADVYSPVSGMIIEVNQSLQASPEKVNYSPEKEGWLFKIQLSEPKELEDLLDKQDYLKQLHP